LARSPLPRAFFGHIIGTMTGTMRTPVSRYASAAELGEDVCVWAKGPGCPHCGNAKLVAVVLDDGAALAIVGGLLALLICFA
jgi:hypothetical protein